MTEEPFAPGKWRFDTVCFAGMTERGLVAIPHHEIPEFPGYVMVVTERGTRSGGEGRRKVRGACQSMLPSCFSDRRMVPTVFTKVSSSMVAMVRGRGRRVLAISSR